MFARALLNRYRPFKKRSKPGAVPGTLVSDPDLPSAKITLTSYGPKKYQELEIAQTEELTEKMDGYAVHWIDVVGLGDVDVIRRIGKLFSMHPLAQEDAVHVHQRAKVEDYDEQLFIVGRRVFWDKELRSEQISLLVGKNFVVTFQEMPGDCFDPLRERIRKSRGQIRNLGGDYLAYALLDSIVDSYFPVMEQFSLKLDELENEVLENFEHEQLSEIHHVRSDLLQLRKNIWPHRDAVNQLMREQNPLITQDSMVYWRDCYDHTLQLIEVAETYREVCGDLRDLYFSQVSNKTNEIMKVLTLIATIFIPLGFIAGLYGMNFDVSASPWNMPELHWVYGYPFALGVMGTVVGVMLVFFYRRGWLG